MRIYVVDLEKYNENKETGIWVTLPAGEEEVRKRLGIANGHDYAIHDYECEVELNDIEHCSIDEMNDIAENIKILVDKGIPAEDISELVRMTDYSLKDLVDHAENIISYPGASDMTDVVYQYIEEIGGIEQMNREILKQYFDYGAYARDVELDGCFVSGRNGYYQIE